MKRFALLLLTIAGCTASDYEIQKRKETDRHLILDGQKPAWHSEHDTNIWKDNNIEPRPSMRRILDGADDFPGRGFDGNRGFSNGADDDFRRDMKQLHGGN